MADLDSMTPIATERSGHLWRQAMRWAFLAAPVWPGLALLFAMQQHIADSGMGEPSSILRHLGFASFQWIPWAMLSPLMFWFFLALPLWRRPAVSQIGLHACAVIALVVLQAAMQAIAKSWLMETVDQRTFFEWLTILLQKKAHIEIWIVVAADALAQGFQIMHHARATEKRAKEIELERKSLELSALRRQLEPHFIFNALNSLCALVDEDSAAHAMVLRLGAYLRQVLARDGEDWVSLSDEVGLVTAYLDVEKVRFGDRLHVSWNIQASTRHCRVPTLILQPLVENAVRHGVGKYSTPTMIRIRSWSEGEHFVILVENQSDHPPPNDEGATSAGTGIGLRNVRQRLSLAYGTLATVECRRDNPGHFAVEVRLPRETS